MSFKTIFSLFIFVCSINLSADDSPVRLSSLSAYNETVIQSDNIDIIQHREGGRKWLQQDLQEATIADSFNIWLQCYDNPSSRSDCNNCHGDLPPGVRPLVDITRDQCLPAPSDMQVAYNPHLLPELKSKRDEMICSCYYKRKAGPLSDFAFDLSLSMNRKQDDDDREKFGRCLLTNQLTERYVTARLGVQFSAGSYSLNEKAALALNGIYGNLSGGGGQRGQGHKGGASRKHHGENCGSDKNVEQAAQELARERELTLEDYTSEKLIKERQLCLPYRHYLASKQFPDDQNFYDSLKEEFKWEDWHYTKLLDELRAKTSNGGIKASLARDKSGELKRKFARAKFLYDNPAIQSIFLAKAPSNRDTKKVLYDILKKIPRPVCTTSGCRRDDNWDRSAIDYRAKMDAYLRELPARSATQDGIFNQKNSKLDVGIQSYRSSLVTSDKLVDDKETFSATPREWRFFCDNRDLQQSTKKSPEVKFAIEFEEEVGRHDFESPENDAGYIEMNTHLCAEPRSGKSGTMAFNQFLSNLCGSSTDGQCSISNRPVLLGEFLKKYPNSTEHDDSQKIQAIVPFLGGGIAEIKGVTSQGVEVANIITGDSRLARSSISEIETSLGLPPELRSSDVEVPFARKAEIASNADAESSAQAAQNAQTQAQVNPLSFAPVVEPLIIPQAQNAAASAQPENKFANQNDEMTRGIREEIASLKDVLNKPVSDGGPKDSFETDSLNKRIASLEKELRESKLNQKNRRKRNVDDDSEEIASSDEEIDEPTPKKISQKILQASAPSAQVSSVQQNASPSVINSGGTTSPLPSGGASVSAVSSAGSSAIPSVRGTVTKTPVGGSLSSFGIQETVNQDGITVAVSSGDIDFKRLRQSSENSIITDDISPEEYNLITGNNQGALKRYLDQARTMAGEVVRLELKAEKGKIEIFVVKSGNEISIVQAPSEVQNRLPSNAPKRDSTLDGLNNEIATQTGTTASK